METLKFLKSLKSFSYELVVEKANVQQLEKRGARVVGALFEELISDPKKLVPSSAWNDLNENDSDARRVCDYVAGMTDSYAEKIYHRLFSPGIGSTHDEL